MTAAENAKKSGGFSFFWLIYGQVAAMLGAFSLLVFLTHFFDLGLKGEIRDAFGVWTDYVRPFVGHPIQWLVNLLPEAWRFRVPDVVKDYVAVGLVGMLASFRAERLRGNVIGWSFGNLVGAIIIGGLLVTIWPVGFLLHIYTVIAGGEDRRFAVLSLAPLIYLGLLFAANAWLVR